MTYFLYFFFFIKRWHLNNEGSSREQMAHFFNMFKRIQTWVIGQDSQLPERKKHSPVPAFIDKGRVALLNRMKFWKSSKGGGRGSFSFPIFILQILDLYKVFFGRFLKKLQYNFPKIRGGGLKAVWNFAKNSSDMLV